MRARVRRTLLAAVVALAAAGCAAAPPGSSPTGAGTVWTWEGTRRIDAWVEVPRGVTLRLLPGTVLQFAFLDKDGDGVGEAGLHVLGRIEAVGTPEAPVVFTSAEAAPRPGDWRGLVFDASRGNVFTACRFSYAEHALHAHFSSAVLERCRLEQNVEGTRLGNSRFEIAHSLVRGNVSKGINFFACENRIHHCTITGNGVGIFLFETDTASVVELNNIFGNEGYDFRLGDFYRGGRTLRGNWWGTTDLAVIAEHVYDGADDPELGRLEIEPAGAPIETGWEQR
jgi:hypothetical protein